MLTVLFATRNRASILSSVLECYCKLTPPKFGWKLVVVDNASSDQTRENIFSFANRLPLTYVFERNIGKNFAINAGLNEVEGDLLIFTDDDVFPKDDWLIQLQEAAVAQTEYSIFGGVVLPRWEVHPPHWVTWIKRGPVYALSDQSLEEGPINNTLVFGPNMAIRTKVFQDGICFDPSVGPRGSNYAMGSETELLRRLGLQGHKAWHVKSAVVEHFVSNSQMRKSWVMKRAIRFGRGQYRLLNSVATPNVIMWWGMPRYLIRQLIMHAIDVARAFVSLEEKMLFQSRWELNYLLGQLIEARVVFRERRSRENQV